jgi:Spy/CpxP family protein refolding chaperone
MKSVRTILAITGMAAMTALSLPASAQMGPGPGAGPGMQGGTGKMAASDCQRRLQRLTQRLGLSEEQQAQIKPLLEEEATQVQTLRDDSTLSRDERNAKLQELHESTYNRINGFLTPEQQQKHKELRDQAQQRQKMRRGQPPAATPPKQ